MTTMPTGLEFLRWAVALPEKPANIADFLGMHVETLDEGAVSISMTTRPDYANPLGSLHGGISTTLLDSVMSTAVHTLIGPGESYGTLELKVNFVRSAPADGTRLIGTGTVIHKGRTTATAEGKVIDGDGRLIAHGTTTCIIHPAAAA